MASCCYFSVCLSNMVELSSHHSLESCFHSSTSVFTDSLKYLSPSLSNIPLFCHPQTRPTAVFSVSLCLSASFSFQTNQHKKWQIYLSGLLVLLLFFHASAQVLQGTSTPVLFFFFTSALFLSPLFSFRD